MTRRSRYDRTWTRYPEMSAAARNRDGAFWALRMAAAIRLQIGKADVNRPLALATARTQVMAARACARIGARLP